MRRADFAAAWAISDAVLATRDPATRDDPTLPYHLRWVWDGRPLHGQHVLVRCYHGLGDTLQFCRYLAPLRLRAASVTLEAQPELLPLLATLPGPYRLVPFDPAAPLPPSACDIEIMELAHALRLPPNAAPYLPTRPPVTEVPAIGLCWQAGGWNPGRAMSLHDLAPLAQFAPLVSLQRGPGAAERTAPNAPPTTDPLHGSMDLLAMARLLAGLSLIVTVDTMIAHLAGALGRPTAVLLPSDPDWRWPAGRGSPWYGTARQYRQSQAGRWAEPVAALCADLAAAREPSGSSGFVGQQGFKIGWPGAEQSSTTPGLTACGSSSSA